MKCSDNSTGGAVVLSAIVKINSAAELDNSVWMYDCLAADDAHIINLDPACREKYHRRLFKAKSSKIRVLSHHIQYICSFHKNGICLLPKL